MQSAQVVAEPHGGAHCGRTHDVVWLQTDAGRARPELPGPVQPDGTTCSAPSGTQAHCSRRARERRTRRGGRDQTPDNDGAMV